jgi:hypothetical protein
LSKKILLIFIYPEYINILNYLHFGIKLIIKKNININVIITKNNKRDVIKA